MLCILLHVVFYSKTSSVRSGVVAPPKPERQISLLEKVKFHETSDLSDQLHQITLEDDGLGEEITRPERKITQPYRDETSQRLSVDDLIPDDDLDNTDALLATDEPVKEITRPKPEISDPQRQAVPLSKPVLHAPHKKT